MLSNFQQSILNSESPGTWNVKLGNKLHEMHEHMDNGSMHSKNTNFIIAPSNAVNKERADLVLTGDVDGDAVAINQAITDLHTTRGNANIAIRVDFLGGTVSLELGNQIRIPYDNFKLYGNGVYIVGEGSAQETEGIIHITGDNVTLDGFDALCNFMDGPTVTNVGSFNHIVGNTFKSEYNQGLRNDGNGCYIVDNECSNISNTDVAINNGGMDCVVSGNDVRDGGLTTVEWVFPSEIDALNMLNFGVVSIVEAV